MRIDISMDNGALRADVSGVKVISPYSYECGEYRVDISYKTALLYINGVNVCSFYGGHSPDTTDIYKELYMDMLVNDYDVPSEVAESMSAWIADKIEK